MIVILSIWIFSNAESLLNQPLTAPNQFLSDIPYNTLSIFLKRCHPNSTQFNHSGLLIRVDHDRLWSLFSSDKKEPAVTLLLGYRINRRGASAQLSPGRVIRLSVTN